MEFKSNARYGEPKENGTIFNGEIGNLKLSVHRIIHCDGWFLSCPNIRISQMKLKSDTLIEAINESKIVLKKMVENLSDDINAFYEESIEISK